MSVECSTNSLNRIAFRDLGNMGISFTFFGSFLLFQDT